MRLVAILILTVFASINAQELSPEDQEYVEQYRKECMEETGAAKELILKASKGDIANDPKLLDHILCVFKKAQFADSSGKTQKHNILLDLDKVMKDKKAAERIVDECAKDRETPQITAVENYKCFYKRTGLKIL